MDVTTSTMELMIRITNRVIITKSLMNNVATLMMMTSPQVKCAAHAEEVESVA